VAQGPQWNGKFQPFHGKLNARLNPLVSASPGQLRAAIAEFIVFYNYCRHQKGMRNVTPTEVYYISPWLQQPYIEQCAEKYIEVVWKSSLSTGRQRQRVLRLRRPFGVDSHSRLPRAQEKKIVARLPRKQLKLGSLQHLGVNSPVQRILKP